MLRASVRGISLSPSQHPIYAIKAEFFRVLGHPKRVRILELLRDGERTVGDLQSLLRLDSSGTSQHLSALRRLGVLTSRRDGTNVYYRVRDERIFELLSIAHAVVSTNIEQAQAMLGGQDGQAASGGSSSGAGTIG